MFSVLFEVHPKSDRRDAYLGYAKMLKPELEQIEGFIDNIRYRSPARDGYCHFQVGATKRRRSAGAPGRSITTYRRRGAPRFFSIII